MRTIQTPVQASSSPWDNMKAADRAKLLREIKALEGPEASELETGKRLVAVRSICEPYSIFKEVLLSLPFASRTAYRRIRLYDTAVKIWPEEIVEAAIERKMQFVGVPGVSADRPMGNYEGIEVPKKNLTPDKIEEFLVFAEMEVRRSRTDPQPVEAHDALRRSFRQTEVLLRSLSPEERITFVEDIVGLQMTLAGIRSPQKFEPTEIPSDFWPGERISSVETRNRIRLGSLARWQRKREASV